MGTSHDVVLVASPNEDRRAEITSVCRDHWPVRIATTLTGAVDSLDESIAVLVIDDAFEESPAELFERRAEIKRFVQVLWVGETDDPFDDHIDAVIDSGPIGETVRQLQQRARFDRLLTQFYELASARGTGADAPSSEFEPTGSGLTSLKRELDGIAAKLDDKDAFEVALRDRQSVNW